MKIRKFYTLSLMVLAVSCSSIYGVSYDYDEKVNFSRLRSYDWFPLTMNHANEKSGRIDSISLERIRNAVYNQLESKGLTVSEKNPDFLIAVYLSTKERLSVSNYGGPYPYPHYEYGPYWGTLTIRQYEEGTLLLDFVDTESKQLIWRGSAKSDLDSVRTPQKREEVINEAVQKILENFPPPT
jgi:hypothetical protein